VRQRDHTVLTVDTNAQRLRQPARRNGTARNGTFDGRLDRVGLGKKLIDEQRPELGRAAEDVGKTVFQGV
jgi:hypothetical protein